MNDDGQAPTASISRCNTAGVRLLLGLALIVITWLALTPQPVAMQPGLHIDKWSHLAAFLVLALLTDLSWPERRFDLGKWLPLAAYGVILELVQMQIPNRMFDPADVIADLLGLALYALLGTRVLRLLGMR